MEAAVTAATPVTTPTPAPAGGAASDVPTPTSGAPPSPPADSAAGSEKPTEGEKPAETPQQKLERLSRAGKAARRAAARNRELLARNAQLEQTARAAMATAQHREQEFARLRGLKPIELAKELGLSAKQVAEEAMREGSPEAALEKRLREIEARAERAEKALEERTQSEQTEQRRAVMHAAAEAFQAEAGDATAFPTVSKMPAAARLAWAQQLLAEDRERARAQGVDLRTYAPTNRQVLAHMEKLAASQSQSGAPPKDPPVASPDATTNGSTTPQTVSNAAASAKYTLPANFDQLPDSEQKSHLARMMEDIVPGAKKKPRR